MQYITSRLQSGLSFLGSKSATSKQEQETARKVADDIYSLYKEGKMEEMLQAYVAQDVELKVPLDLTDPQSRKPFFCHGRDKVYDYTKGWQELFDTSELDVSLTMADVSGAGGTSGVYVVKVLSVKMTCKKTGQSTTRCLAHLMLVNPDRKQVVRFEEFSDTAEVLRLCE